MMQFIETVVNVFDVLHIYYLELRPRSKFKICHKFVLYIVYLEAIFHAFHYYLHLSCFIIICLLQIRVNQDQFEDEMECTLLGNLNSSPKLRRISVLNKNQARSNVVNEIINAEREYVKHLKDVVEASTFNIYILSCQKGR